MQAENLGVSTPVVVLPTWAKRGFGALPRGSLDDVEGELAVARATVIFEGLNFAHMGKRRDPGVRCPTARPLDYLERKLACAQGGHHEAPALVRCIGLVVAPAAERDQSIEVKVGTALRVRASGMRQLATECDDARSLGTLPSPSLLPSHPKSY